MLRDYNSIYLYLTTQQQNTQKNLVGKFFRFSQYPVFIIN